MIPDEIDTNRAENPESDSYEALPAADNGETARDQQSFDSGSSLEASENIEGDDPEDSANIVNPDEETDLLPSDLKPSYVPDLLKESENVTGSESMILPEAADTDENVPDPETLEEGTSTSVSVSNSELYALVQENFSVTIEMMALQTGIMILILGMVIFRFIYRLFTNMVTKYLS